MKQRRLRRRATVRVLVLALALPLAFASPVTCQSVAGAETVVVHTGTLDLRGLIWRPHGVGPFPAVLFNHGSALPRELHKPDALGPTFASRGYVFLFLYRQGSGLSRNQGSNSAELMGRAFAERDRQRATRSNCSCSRPR